MNLKVEFRSEILSDFKGVMTVAFLSRLVGKDDWNCCLITAGESYNMLHRIDKLNGE